MKLLKNTRSALTFLILASVITGLMFPSAALADGNDENEDEDNVVRIGWYDSSFCYYDSFGRRCGIDYEYHPLYVSLP